MDESLQKYNSFDFAANPQWVLYFTNLFPTPPHDLIDKLKRKWYKKNIDPSFPFESQSSIPQQNQQNPQNSQQNPQNHQNSQQIPQQNFLYKIEGYLKLFFFPGLLILSGFHLKLLISVICLMAIIRNFGFPKLNKEYFTKLIPSEFSANLLYLLSISLHSSQNGFLFFLPIAIHFVSGIVEFINKTNPGLLAINPKVLETANVIKNNRNSLILAKNKVEFGIFVYLFIIWFVGLSSLFQIVIYLQFLNLKYKFNGNMQTGIWELRNSLVNNPSLPGFLKNICNKFFELFIKAMNLF